MSTEIEQLSAMLQAMISVRDKVKVLEADKEKLHIKYDKAILALKIIYDDGITRDRPCEIAENTLHELGELP